MEWSGVEWSVVECDVVKRSEGECNVISVV